MLYEVSRKIINISKFEETNITWVNSVLTVSGIKELHLLEFSHNLYSLEKAIDFKESVVRCSKTSPMTNDYLPSYVSRGVKNLELVEMITNSAFWPHNKLLMQELTKIIAYQWSPFHIVSENDGLLATLNSVGKVEFFAAKGHAWCSVKDFSSEIKAHLTENLDKLCEVPRNFSDVKDTVYTLETASMCWAPCLDKDNSCFFATAQKSGDILFWSIKCGSFETELCGSVLSIPNVEIVHMVWITLQETEFLLICLNEYGEITMYECQIIEKKISQWQAHNVWAHKDKMISKYIHYHFYDDKLLLFFNKYRHLVVQMYDKSLKLLSQCVQNVNDYKITCLTKHDSTFYLTTVNMKIYKINYSIQCNKLQVLLEAVEFKESSPTYELYGIAVSRNSALFALTMINRKLLRKKETINIEVVLLSPDTGCEVEIKNIISNPSKKLTHIWDLIEALRCKVMKTKKLPEIDYSLLLEDDSDLYNHKVYLIILKFYQNLRNCLTNRRILEASVPETSIEYVKEKILMLQAFTKIHECYDSFQTNLCLSTFDLECFAGCKNYLNYYCNAYKKNLSDLITADVLNISNVCFKYLCQWCDEHMVDFSCKNKHVNMMCSITFTPIENDYLVCKSCNATARIELKNQNATCIFCDLYLISSE